MRNAWLLSVLVLCGMVGCGGSETPTATSPTAGAALAPQQRPTDPVSAAAYDFVSAVVQGETERATNLLTPQAVAQFAAAGKQFAFPGMGSASFQIGQSRLPTPNQAAVQCLLADSQAGGATEEMCCLMRLVEGNWRVWGIAFEVGANQPQILNFEQPEAPPAQAKPNPQFVTKPAADSAPRTAQDPFATPTR